MRKGAVHHVQMVTVKSNVRRLDSWFQLRIEGEAWAGRRIPLKQFFLQQLFHVESELYISIKINGDIEKDQSPLEHY